MHAIATDRLTKAYGAFLALRGISLRVPRGAIFGFLGPNGAGKTTTLRILMGLLRPTGGRAQVLGLDCLRDAVRIRARVGYLPGDLRLYENLRGSELLAFLSRVRRVDCDAAIQRLAERLDLDLSRRVRSYSKGMKQKLGLIQALMHGPELLMLDEPTGSLDPLVQQALFEELRAAARDGRTVLFSSHVLAEVEALCDQVAIVRAGELVEQDRIESLRSRAVRRVELAFVDGRVPDLPRGMLVRERRGPRLIAAWTGPVQPLLTWLAEAAVEDARVGPPDLEELFLAYYGESPGRERREAERGAGEPE